MDFATIDIAEVIKEKRIITIYQPIVSVLKRSIIGTEALCRGTVPDSYGAWIPPYPLFKAAHQQNKLVEFDRLCRGSALETYRENYGLSCLPPCQPLLFLNMDTSIIDQGVVGSGYLIDSVRRLGLNPKHIVIEILESKVKDTQALKLFVDTYKEHGFLIALDDVGAGHSNLDRIPIIKPDIIKIDRSLINNIDNEFYKQEVFRSLSNLAKKLGSLVVAEGVESIQEAITVMELGADFLQGYYFMQPNNLTEEMLEETYQKIDIVADTFGKSTLKKLRARRAEYEAYDFIVNQVIEELEKLPVEKFDDALGKLTKLFMNLECMYVLDRSGKQVSDTVFFKSWDEDKGYVYQPAEKGTDHSLKQYYLFISTGQNKHITDSYISLASGNLCVTVSTAFKGQNKEEFILCVDLYPQAYM